MICERCDQFNIKGKSTEWYPMKKIRPLIANRKNPLWMTWRKDAYAIWKTNNICIDGYPLASRTNFWRALWTQFSIIQQVNIRFDGVRQSVDNGMPFSSIQHRQLNFILFYQLLCNKYDSKWASFPELRVKLKWNITEHFHKSELYFCDLSHMQLPSIG